MRAYLICSRRKGEPKVAVDVCMICRYRGKCRPFRDYRCPRLFSDPVKPIRNSAT